MIEPNPDMQFDSDFTDDHLRFISDTLGPQVKDALLLPGPVPIEGAGYAPIRNYWMALGT